MQILLNGRVYSRDAAPTRPTALAVDRGEILALGSDADLLSEYGKGAQVLNLHGRTVWPGLTDAHLHLYHYAISLSVVDCETSTRAGCLQRVSERHAGLPQGAWLRGHGWNQNVWPEGFGDAALLEAAAPGRPVYLTAKSLHAGWASPRALQIAGIHSGSPDPEGGRIVRDDQGRPTGILLESAMELVERCIPVPTLSESVAALQAAQQTLWKMGLTGVHDFDGPRCFAALQELDRDDRLRLRVVKSIPHERLAEAAAVGLRSGFGSQYLRIGAVKLFSDGALGPRTAAMLQPYEGEAENAGILLLDNEQVFEIGQTAVSAGIDMAIHAIGDRANHEMLLGYAQIRRFEKEQGLAPRRLRIEHVQLLHPSDFTRLAELDVIASVQPIHATSDMHIADRFWGARASGAYAFRTLLEAGTRLIFGSDAPVESPNPFLGLHAAVTRRRADGTPGVDGWYPGQRLALADALAAYTTGPAEVAGWDQRIGKLLPGYVADLIILDQDPFELPADALASLAPSAVMVGGEWVWHSDNLDVK